METMRLSFENSIVRVLFLILHLLLATFSSINYPGSLLTYGLFSAAFMIVLLKTCTSVDSPSSLFFGLMIWMGFFVKTAFHLILKYPFLEPVGGFTGTPAQWDQVLLVTSVGGLAFAGFKILADWLFKTRQSNKFVLGPADQVSAVYLKYRSWIILTTLGLIAAVSILNIVYGINMSGLVAFTVLPWPVNAITGWILYMGFALAISQFSFWAYNNGRKFIPEILLSIVESLLSSVSVISRGLFLFHLVPTLFVYTYNSVKMKIRWSLLGALAMVVLGAFLANSVGVTKVRESLFDDGSFIYDFYDIGDEDSLLFDIQELQNPEIKGTLAGLSERPTAAPSVSVQSYSILNAVTTTDKKPSNDIANGLIQISRLIIDRWVGIEGMMAVVSYPEISLELMVASFFRVPKIGELDVYEKIARSPYQPSLRYSFASIPGPVAFLYYTGSLLVVVGGMLMFSLILYALDQVLHFAFKNPFLTAQVGFYVANGIAQFGISPRPLGVSFLMTTIALVGLFLFNRFILKIPGKR
jgi:hypothetical protein